jgi:hypothetical protein
MLISQKSTSILKIAAMAADLIFQEKEREVNEEWTL